jgi:hypothetical protein
MCAVRMLCNLHRDDSDGPRCGTSAAGEAKGVGGKGMSTDHVRHLGKWIFLAVSLALIALYARVQLVYSLAFAGQVLLLVARRLGTAAPDIAP